MTQADDQNVDTTDDDLRSEPSRVHLHAYWLRAGNRDTLLQFLALFRAIQDCLDKVDSDLPDHPRRVLWKQVDSAAARKVWNSDEADFFYQTLTIRREIMSQGAKPVSAGGLESRTLALATLLHKLQNHADWMIPE